MKLEEGMYVRHHRFGIGRVINSYERDNRTWFNVKFKCYGDNECHCGICEQSVGFKPSYNIIDLIEVGDYVNGVEITLIREPSLANCNKRLIYAEDGKGYLMKMFGEEDIKSIVTKEQFESVMYKVK